MEHRSTPSPSDKSPAVVVLVVGHVVLLTNKWMVSFKKSQWSKKDVLYLLRNTKKGFATFRYLLISSSGE